MPPEVRIEIYRLLLVNPLLSEYHSVRENDGFGALIQYDIHPAILAVNHQVHNEAFEILYGDNKFYVALQDDFDWMPTGILLAISPITRYQHGHQGLTAPQKASLARAVVAMTKVQHWKVVLSAGIGDNLSILGPWAFKSFCRMICRSPIQSLDIAVIPPGMEMEIINYFPMMMVLNPLRLIRGIDERNLSIRSSRRSEGPDVTIDVSVASSPDVSSDIEVKGLPQLKNLITSNDIIELAFEMYSLLINYAEGFERHPRFKGDMSLNCTDMITPWRTAKYCGYITDDNPFFQGSRHRPSKHHPVEYNLLRARRAINLDNTPRFKCHRAAVLKYLELQYQRICRAAKKLFDFVSWERVQGNIFDTSLTVDELFEIKWERYETAMTLLQDYSASFDRDMPPGVKNYIQQDQAAFDKLYSQLEPKLLVNKAHLSTVTLDCEDFAGCYQAAVDSLNIQYFEIRKARKALFDADILGAPKVVLGLEIIPFDCDGPIDWSIKESGPESVHESEEQ